MQEFEVCFHYQENGKTIVRANTAHEAELKIYKHLENEGLDNLQYRTNDREYGVTCVRTLGKSLFGLKIHPPSK